MPSLLPQFSAAQLAIISERAATTEKQAVSTATLTVADESNEFFLDDPSALFRTNEITFGDILYIEAGTDPVGMYTVSGNYFDPGVDGGEQIASETRIIGIGTPTPGTVTYTVFEPTSLLAEWARLTETISLLRYVVNPEIQVLDDIYKIYMDQFDAAINYTSNERLWLDDKDRTRITPALLDAATNPANAAYGDNSLFPLGHTELSPSEVAIDTFVANSPATEDDERFNQLEEFTQGDPLGPADTITGPLQDALNAEDAALDKQRAAIGGSLIALDAEVDANDTVGEAGAYNTLYLGIKTTVDDALIHTQERIDDIADIFSDNRQREETPTTLNHETYVAALAEIDARIAQLGSTPYTDFLTERFKWLDLRVNRAHGTLTRIAGNNHIISINEDRIKMICGEINSHRLLLNITPLFVCPP